METSASKIWLLLRTTMIDKELVAEESLLLSKNASSIGESQSISESTVSWPVVKLHLIVSRLEYYKVSQLS